MALSHGSLDMICTPASAGVSGAVKVANNSETPDLIRGLLAIQLVDDVDLDVLEELITKSVKWMRNKYGK